MRDILLFLVGLVVAPGVTAIGVAATRLCRTASDLSPGSRRARAVGCVCSRGRNFWGLREALRGTCEVTLGCPVFQHHPEARPGMYIRRK